MEAPRKKSARVKLTPPSSSTCLISNLPNPILMEILCGLPIKTLAACKCVCKPWLHLIGDPHFCQLHHPRAPTEVCFRCFHDGDSTKLYMGNLRFLSSFNPFDVLFEFPKFSVRANNALNFQAIKHDYYFANSCNGLLCYYGGSNNRFAVVWNPCTSEFITFPAPKPQKGLSTCRGYGLGFSSKANKFKLLRVMGRKDTASSAEVVVGEVCSIEKSCSWKTIGPCRSDIWGPLALECYGKEEKYATFLQGALHWVGSSDSSGSEISIHTFDFEDEQFGSVPLPLDFVQTFENSYPLRENEERLGVLAGCLFITERVDHGTNIWLMKEYGVQDSWTKLFCFEYPIDKRISYHICQPITYMDNGEVLMICRNNPAIVFLYNPLQKRVSVLGSGPPLLCVIAYRPSLVLLKNSMLGYHVHIKPRCADSRHRELYTTPGWWEPEEEESQEKRGSQASLTSGELTDSSEEEEREGHVSATSKFSAPESSAAELARRQGSKTPKMTDETCVSATKEDPLERIKTMEEVLEELRKEREHRQELEERLRNEIAKVEPLKEQIQQLEERLQDEHAKVSQLRDQIQQSEQLKQENDQRMDESRA